MSRAEIPDGWKDRPEYDLEDAVRLWACVFYGVPLEQPRKLSERNDYRREYEAARQDLRGAGIVQEQHFTVEVMTRARVPDHARSYVGYSRSTYAYPEQEKRTRQRICGPDLAAAAKERGKPGVFGFEEEPKPTPVPPGAVSEREEAKVLEILAAVLVAKYGEGILVDLKGNKSSMFGRVFQDVTRRSSVSEATLRKYSERLPD